jgi:1,4-dihydroxy-2-naphthoyl-CoA hydrolase
MAPYEALIGLEVDAASPEEARGRLPAVNAVKQPAGLVHGGIYPSMAESLGTRAMAEAVAPATAIGHSSQTSFLRPVLEGQVHAAGRPRHRGRSTWVWEFDITDDEGRLCALVRMTIRVC